MKMYWKQGLLITDIREKTIEKSNQIKKTNKKCLMYYFFDILYVLHCLNYTKKRANFDFR